MKHIIMVIAILGLMALNLKAQDAATKQPQKFTLQEAVAYAKKYNYTLKNSSLEVLAAEKKVKEVLAAGLPNVNASGTLNNYITVPSNVIDFGGQRQVIRFGVPFSAVGAIDASQLLFDGGFLMGLKASKEFVNMSKINLKRSEVETEVSVSKAYYSILLVKVNLDLLEANIVATAKTKHDLEKSTQQGLTDKIEYDRIGLQLSSLELQKEQLIDQEKILLMVLKLQLGLNVNDKIELTDDLQKMFELTKKMAVAEKVEYSNRYEYQALSQSIRLNQMDKKRYQFGYAPSLVAFFNHQENSFATTYNGLGKQWYSGTLWGLKLSVPIFDGLKKQAQIQQADVNIKKAENDRKNLENVIDQEVFKAKTTFERAGKQLEIQKKNFELAQEIYNRVQLKYNSGLGSSLDLTVAQRDLESSRSSYLTNLYDYFVAQLDLRKAIGDLNK